MVRADSMTDFNTQSENKVTAEAAQKPLMSLYTVKNVIKGKMTF